MPSPYRNIYIGLLLIPILSFFSFATPLISFLSNFLCILLILPITYLAHSSRFHTLSLQIGRKCVACVGTAILIMVILMEVETTMIETYKVDFGEEVMFWVRVIIIIANLEGNLELVGGKQIRNSTKEGIQINERTEHIAPI